LSGRQYRAWASSDRLSSNPATRSVGVLRQVKIASRVRGVVGPYKANGALWAFSRLFRLNISDPPHLRKSAACHAVLSAIVLGTRDDGGRLCEGGLICGSSVFVSIRVHSRLFRRFWLRLSTRCGLRPIALTRRFVLVLVLESSVRHPPECPRRLAHSPIRLLASGYWLSFIREALSLLHAISIDFRKTASVDLVAQLIRELYDPSSFSVWSPPIQLLTSNPGEKSTYK
jgi:hypothetical protein